MVVIVQTSKLDTCGGVGDEPIVASSRYRECAASNLDSDDPAIKVRLGIRFAVPVHPECTNLPVQPGCTNLGLSALLFKNHANHDGHIRCGLSPAETEYKSRMAGVYSYTDTRRTYGESQALVYSAIFCDWKDAVEISKDRGEELVSATTGPDSGGNDSCHHHRAGEG